MCAEMSCLLFVTQLLPWDWSYSLVDRIGSISPIRQGPLGRAAVEPRGGACTVGQPLELKSSLADPSGRGLPAGLAASEPHVSRSCSLSLLLLERLSDNISEMKNRVSASEDVIIELEAVSQGKDFVSKS